MNTEHDALSGQPDYSLGAEAVGIQRLPENSKLNESVVFTDVVQCETFDISPVLASLEDVTEEQTDSIPKSHIYSVTRYEDHFDTNSENSEQNEPEVNMDVAESESFDISPARWSLEDVTEEQTDSAGKSHICSITRYEDRFDTGSENSKRNEPEVVMNVVESERFDISPALGSPGDVRADQTDSIRKSHKYSVTRYEDHFSLPIRSSTIRFRSSNIAHRVYENKHSQFVLEQTPDRITVKKMEDSTTSLKFLRSIYTLMCLFFLGFLLVFAVQVLLFTLQDLAIDIGATSKSAGDIPHAIGIILSLPVFVLGLASALVICGYYVADTWGGSYLIKNFVFEKYNAVFTAWLTFIVFLGKTHNTIFDAKNKQ